MMILINVYICVCIIYRAVVGRLTCKTGTRLCKSDKNINAVLPLALLGKHGTHAGLHHLPIILRIHHPVPPMRKAHALGLWNESSQWSQLSSSRNHCGQNDAQVLPSTHHAPQCVVSHGRATHARQHLGLHAGGLVLVLFILLLLLIIIIRGYCWREQGSRLCVYMCMCVYVCVCICTRSMVGIGRPQSVGIPGNAQGQPCSAQRWRQAHGRNSPLRESSEKRARNEQEPTTPFAYVTHNNRCLHTCQTHHVQPQTHL